MSKIYFVNYYKKNRLKILNKQKERYHRIKILKGRKPPIERFLPKVRKTDGCWFWEGAGDKYGVFWDGKRQDMAHRFSYFYYIGEIPNDLQVCHRCDNPNCVNPKHLFLGTQKENLHDMFKKGRQRPINTYKKGPEHCNAKLTKENVIEISKLYKPFIITYNQLAVRFGVSYYTIKNVIRKETYSNV